MSTQRERIPVYLALVHHPVLNRKGDTVTTAVTNLDVHDGCRLSATFGLKRYFLVTPIEEQRSLVTRITSHWITGPGAKRNPKRQMAMSKALPIESLQKACTWIEEHEGLPPLLVGTSARRRDVEHLTYEELKERIHTPQEGSRPILLICGTGWGITEDVQPPINIMLPPIWGGTEYNHLSVRAAMAITIDRLMGESKEVV